MDITLDPPAGKYYLIITFRQNKKNNNAGIVQKKFKNLNFFCTSA